MGRPLLDLCILDALSIDLEDVEHLLEILNSESEFGWRDVHPAPFTRAEIQPALLRLIRDGLIEACLYSPAAGALIGCGIGVLPPAGEWEDSWFVLTPHGRMVLDAWEPPPLPHVAAERTHRA